MKEQEIEIKLREMFDQNYELIRLEGGFAMTPDVVESAYKQVLYY